MEIRQSAALAALIFKKCRRAVVGTSEERQQQWGQVGFVSQEHLPCLQGPHILVSPQGTQPLGAEPSWVPAQAHLQLPSLLLLA